MRIGKPLVWAIVSFDVRLNAGNPEFPRSRPRCTTAARLERSDPEPSILAFHRDGGDLP